MQRPTFVRGMFMSFRNRVFLPIALFSLAFLVACGSSSNKAAPPPTGGFGNSNFNGTYVFSFSGTDYSAESLGDNPSFFAAAGTLTANGSGGLTGTIDLVDPDLEAALGISSFVYTGLSATGNYSVTADGRGTGSINFTIPSSSSVTFGLDFVLTSNSHGLITRFDTNGTGSGTLDLQTSGVAQTALAGSYSFALSGADSSGNPLGTVGSVTLGATGAVTSGIEDFNDNGNSTNLQALALQTSSGIFVPASGSAAGTATLTTNNGEFPSFGFDVWIIDSTHLKLIETAGNGVLAGDAYVSTGQSFPSGNIVFTTSGNDSEGGPLVSGAVLAAASGTISTGLENWNDTVAGAGSGSPNGSYATTGARTLLTLNGFYNGGWLQANESNTGTYSFAAYPFSYGTSGSGVVLLEVDNGTGGISAGTAFLQSTTSFNTSAQGYGLNLTGADVGENEEGQESSEEVDMIAEFTASSTSDITGLYDVNNAGSLISDYNLNTSNNASYSVSSNGQGTMQFPSLQTNDNSVTGTIGLTFYTVDGSNNIFLETDTSGQLTTGSFQLQSAPGSSAESAMLPHFAMAHPTAKGALKARQNRQKK
jgi:hypothetical protein